jgi:hypothetical protein
LKSLWEQSKAKWQSFRGEKYPMRGRIAVFLAGGLLAGQATTALADVTISSAATANMDCADGVCAPTAKNATMNVADPETLLAAGDVTTTGSAVQASAIEIDAPLSWSNTSALTLDAWRSIMVENQESATAEGNIALATNDGDTKGNLSFTQGSDVTFQNLASQLAIDGKSYALVKSVGALAYAVAANSGGNFALATSYDVSGDGTYTESPESNTFRGSFEGLGNAISNLTINSYSSNVGLFAQIKNAQLRDIDLVNANVIDEAKRDANIGLLVGYIENGIIQNVYVGVTQLGG